MLCTSVVRHAVYEHMLYSYSRINHNRKQLPR